MKYTDFYQLNEISSNPKSFDDIVKQALNKYSRADDATVIKFTNTAQRLDPQTIAGLKANVRDNKWNDHTVRAIYTILAQKSKSKL